MTPDPFLQAKREAIDHVIRLDLVCGLSQIIGQKPVIAFDRAISQRSVGEGGQRKGSTKTKYEEMRNDGDRCPGST